MTGAIVGIFGHGCAHLWIALQEGEDTGILAHQTEKDMAWHARIVGVLVFFWFTLTLSSRDTLGKVGHACLALCFIVFHYFFVKQQISFAYV